MFFKRKTCGRLLEGFVYILQTIQTRYSIVQVSIHKYMKHSLNV